MKDQRLYGKFTLDFPDHPKIAILSDAAFRCLVEATLWSRSKLLDGRLPRRYAVAKWSLEILHELCDNDPDFPSLLETDDAFIIHDYAAHQETRAEVDARRERNRIAGQKGGLAKAKRPAKHRAKRAASQPLSESLSRERETLGLDPNGSSPPDTQRAPHGALRIRDDDEPPPEDDRSEYIAAAQRRMPEIRAALTKKPQPL